MKWNKRFIEMAEKVSTWSRDPSTKCGAVITKGKFIVSVGYNGFPKGCDDNKTTYRNRKRKYARVMHAEMNAILTAKQNLEDCTIYVYPFIPCSQCAAAIIQTGIKEVVTMKAKGKLEQRWKESIMESLIMFEEAGVKIKYLKRDENENN